MKKLAITALLVAASTATFAAPVGNTFAGFGVGIDLTTTKYKDTDKRATGVGLVADYGIDYGNNFVGLIEGKVKFNSSKLIDEVIVENDGGHTSTTSIKESEKWRANLSYLQGYRVLPDLLPYVKVSYQLTKFKGDYNEKEPGYSGSESLSETKSGFGYGLGVKYAVSSNFELGAEYLRTRTKLEHDHLDGNTFGASATYRF